MEELSSSLNCTARIKVIIIITLISYSSRMILLVIFAIDQELFLHFILFSCYPRVLLLSTKKS